MTTITKTEKAKAGELASTEHVEQLIRGYKKERWVYNCDRLGKPDALSTWYGLEELSEFLELAREHQADGIKMYFGVYPDTYVKKPGYAGRQTVVLVATKKKETDLGTINKHIYRGSDGQILAFNYGEACPPLCIKPPGDEGLSIELERTGLSIIDHNGEIKIA